MGGGVIFVWMLVCAVESPPVCYCSQNDGAGDVKRIKSGIRSAVIIMTVAGGAIILTLMLFGEPFIRIFPGGGTDADTLATLDTAKQGVPRLIRCPKCQPYHSVICRLRTSP